MLVRLLLLILLSHSIAACDAAIAASGGGSNPGGNAGESFPSRTSMLRMTKLQHQRALGDLLVQFLGGDAEPVLDAAESAYGIIPDDPADLEFGELVGSTFSRMSQNVSELHIRGYYDVASSVAESIVTDELLRQALFGPCVDEPGTDHADCVKPFVDEFGLWTSRRPLSEEEQAFFIDTVFANDGQSYEATPRALYDLLVAMLVSPPFLYFIEDRGTEVEPGRYELDAFELATRLSFHFWDSMPDEELLDAAADGSLLTEEVYRAQVDRIYADEKTQQTFDRFFFEWLALYRTGDPFGGVESLDPQKLAFIDGYEVSSELRDHMIAEVLDMTEYYRERGTFDDLFTSNLSFARTEDLAAIYEVPVWDGTDEPAEFPTTERKGVLGRAALLSAATVYTHPILRGVRIRQNLLCDDLGSPPADLNGAPDEATSQMTTRQRIEALTSPASCSGCHQFINGLGFPFESFDALGRHRQSEMIIGTEGDVTTQPVDLDTFPFIDGPTDPVAVSGPEELVDELLESGKLHRCFAKHYVRFALGLPSDPSFGGTDETVDVLAQELMAGAPLAEVFKAVASMPAFKQRVRGDAS